MYTIKLRRQNHRLSLKRVVTPIRIKHVLSAINIKHTGQRGIPGESIKGEKGDPGVGLLPGGGTGQVLAKASEQDYDMQWVAFEGNDKTYTQSFTVSNEVVVTHNLNKFPAVTVIDSAEEQVEGEVDYINNNQVLVRFVYPFSGRVICN